MRGTFLWNYFEIKPSAWEEMSLEKFGFFFFSIFSFGGHLDQWSGAILEILVQGHERKIFEIILKSSYQHEMRYHSKIFFSIFSSGGHLVQCSGTILAILVQGYDRNISVKFWNEPWAWEEMSFKDFFSSSFSSGDHLVQWSGTI